MTESHAEESEEHTIAGRLIPSARPLLGTAFAACKINTAERLEADEIVSKESQAVPWREFF